MVKHKNILILDDDLDDIEIFSSVLREIDPSIQVSGISSCTTALAELSDGSLPQPNYIFLDINMPKIDGFECLRQITKLPIYKAVPIIIFSTSKDPAHKAKAMQLGATAYVEKPNTLEEIRSVMRKYFSNEAKSEEWIN